MIPVIDGAALIGGSRAPETWPTTELDPNRARPCELAIPNVNLALTMTMRSVNAN